MDHTHTGDHLPLPRKSNDAQSVVTRGNGSRCLADLLRCRGGVRGVSSPASPSTAEQPLERLAAQPRCVPARSLVFHLGVQDIDLTDVPGAFDDFLALFHDHPASNKAGAVVEGVSPQGATPSARPDAERMVNP